MKFLVHFILIFFICLNAFAQIPEAGIQIQGIVIDNDTGEPVPYCNIAVESSFTGTASNELGEFVIDVNALPTKLVFSHLNYEKQQLEISGTSDLIVELVPLTNILDEVVVVDSKRDKYAFELAKKAFQKPIENQTNVNTVGLFTGRNRKMVMPIPNFPRSSMTFTTPQGALGIGKFWKAGTP